MTELTEEDIRKAFTEAGLFLHRRHEDARGEGAIPLTDQIDEAARATRKYATTLHEAGLFRVVPWEQTGEETFVFESSDEGEAQAACDRMNLLAALMALREPSEGMVDAIGVGTVETDANRWRTMIDALITEVREAGNDA